MRVVSDKIIELRDLIQDWIEVVSNYDLIDDDQYTSAPRGQPYLTFSMPASISRNAQGDDVLYSKVENAFIHVGSRNVTVSIKARGMPANGSSRNLLRGTDMLADLDWSLSKPEIKTKWEQAGFTIRSVEPVIDTSAVEDNVLIPRAAFDLLLTFSIREVVDQNYISVIELSGALDTKQSGDFNYEIGSVTITIPEGE